MVLFGISPLISPTLLKILAEMGHGDEIVLADCNFPSHSICPPHIPVVRADGISISALLRSILPLFKLDYVVVPVMMMQGIQGDTADPSVEAEILDALKPFYDRKIQKYERLLFYEKSKNAFAIVVTGETRRYGNLILRKGVTPISW